MPGHRGPAGGRRGRGRLLPPPARAPPVDHAHRPRLCGALPADKWSPSDHRAMQGTQGGRGAAASCTGFRRVREGGGFCAAPARARLPVRPGVGLVDECRACSTRAKGCLPAARDQRCTRGVRPPRSCACVPLHAVQSSSLHAWGVHPNRLGARVARRKRPSHAAAAAGACPLRHRTQCELWCRCCCCCCSPRRAHTHSVVACPSSPAGEWGRRRRCALRCRARGLQALAPPFTQTPLARVLATTSSRSTASPRPTRSRDAQPRGPPSKWQRRAM